MDYSTWVPLAAVVLLWIVVETATRRIVAAINANTDQLRKYTDEVTEALRALPDDATT